MFSPQQQHLLNLGQANAHLHRNIGAILGDIRGFDEDIR